MSIKILVATKEHLDWINSQYKEINFKLSDLDKEEIIIAEYDNSKVGVGRLQEIDNHNSELGGIYILPNYRNLGIASKIVSELLLIGAKYKRIYCLPFSHLNQFYTRFGFSDVDDQRLVPNKILKKHKWCNDTYNEKVLLLEKNRY